MRRFGVGGGRGRVWARGWEQDIFEGFLISAWRTLQTPCLRFSHKPLLCSVLCPLSPAGTTSIKLCFMSLSSSAFTSDRGLENPEDEKRHPLPACCCLVGLSSAGEEVRIWPLSLESLIITSWKGLLFQVCKPALSIYGAFPVLHCWWDQVTREKRNNWVVGFFFLVKAMAHMEMSTVTGINISGSHL